MTDGKATVTVATYIKICQRRLRQEYWLYVATITGLFLAVDLTLPFMKPYQSSGQGAGVAVAMSVIGFLVGWADVALIKHARGMLRLPYEQWEKAAREAAEEDGVPLVD